ncbi:LysR substrate-binding domain-containing protein, partial [Listeria seeligeri]|uniref:LysR substrate-binding domain-containing protein n=2 Tax=Bacteria TaxID=2 RepID=UPI0022EA5E93
INTARLTAKTLIEPHLPEFFARYPELRVELVMDDGLSSIVAEGCDAGIRLGERLAEGMIAVPVTPMLEMVVVASPAYLARHGTPSTPAELAGHEC